MNSRSVKDNQKMQYTVGQQPQQQHSNSFQSSKNSKESAGKGEYKLLFPTNFVTQNTRRGLLEAFLLFMFIGGILILSLILSVQSSKDTQETSKQMQLMQKQISELSEDVKNKLEKNDFQYVSQSLILMKSKEEQMVKDIALLSEQSKNDYKKIMKNQSDSIAANIAQVQTLKDTLSQIAFQQEQSKIDLASLPQLFQRQIELNSTVNSISKDLDELKKGYQIISQLSNNLSVLSSEEKRSQQDIIGLQLISSKIEGILVKVDNLKGDLDKVQTQQLTLISSSSSNPSIYNVDNKISAIQTDIAALQSQVPFAGVLPTIEHYGPYISTNWIMYILATDTAMTIYPTTEACFITVKSKAVITLTATGGAMCGYHGQMTFLKDRKVNVEKSGHEQRFYGTQQVFSQWGPVNLTQEFYVDAGTYEFTLGMNPVSGSHQFTTQSISFVAKVQYIS